MKPIRCKPAAWYVRAWWVCLAEIIRLRNDSRILRLVRAWRK